MTEEEKKNEQRILPWRFWFSVVLTAFLMVTFALYLPMRFQYTALTGVHGEMNGMPDMHGVMMSGGGHDEHAPSLSHEAVDVREGLSVDLSVSPVPVQSGTSTRLDFFVNQKPTGTPIPADMLEIEHTKLMHVIGVRDDLEEFFHIHPAPVATSGAFTIQHMFEKPGRYKIWSEVKKDGTNHSFGQEPIEVQGIGERFAKSVSLDRRVRVGDYDVVVNMRDPVVKNRATLLAIEIHARDGKEVNTQDYLGAPMHLSVIKDDLRQFIHTHPEWPGQMHGNAGRLISVAHANGGGHGISFHINFPESGLYKAFAQFRPQETDLPPDDALTASFWIQVDDKTPAAHPKIILFAASLILIALLCWGIKKFLTVKINTV